MTLLLPLVVAATTFLLAAAVLNRRSVAGVHRRVSAHVAPRNVTLPSAGGEAVLLSRFQQPLAATEAQLRRLPFWARFEALVERADLRLRAVELFYATVAAMVVLGLLGLTAGMSPAAVLILECLAVVLLRGWLALRISRRRRAFEDQLPELLNALGSALRAGHGLNQALAAVAADSPEPVAGELGRVLAEARLGRSLEDALGDLAARIGSDDLDFVLDAVVIQRQVGGSLAGIFDIVGESVRGRQQFKLKLRALTAMGRMSGLVLITLPLALALVLSLLNSSYLSPLFTTSTGHTMLVIGAVLMTVGAAWLQKIVSTKG
jgi:tight adherence protein B